MVWAWARWANIDRHNAPLYSLRMVDGDAPAVLVDVAGLEQAVSALIERCDALQRDNDELCLKLARLSAEHERVEQAQELARERVTAVISRLKALEE